MHLQYVFYQRVCFSFFFLIVYLRFITNKINFCSHSLPALQYCSVLSFIFMLLLLPKVFSLLFLSHLLTHMIIIYYLLDILFSLLTSILDWLLLLLLYSSTVRLKCRKSAPVHCDYMWSFSISEYEEKKKIVACTGTHNWLCVDLYMISLFIVLLFLFSLLHFCLRRLSIRLHLPIIKIYGF